MNSRPTLSSHLLVIQVCTIIAFCAFVALPLVVDAHPFFQEGDEGPQDPMAGETGARYHQDWDAFAAIAYIPESTMGVTVARYATKWDENPLAYIPESTMGTGSDHYTLLWDLDADVAYIPESTMGVTARRYEPKWDDNPFAYIPESTLQARIPRSVPNWDALASTAYIPESTMEADFWDYRQYAKEK